ncbi:MAG TPA: chain length determinant protein EpsF [Usitatibacter sp.]|jgi:chain length determinant protein EpsF|nr:chain length determinant protein EpsF [Usitatibacter sp.]
MNFHQFLLALRGRIWLFLSLLAATVIAAIGVTVLLPKTYEANVSILVDNRDEQVINSQQQPARAQLGYMQTQVDIIQSPRVARQVAQDLKLDQSPQVRAAWQKSGGRGTLDDYIAQGLLSKLKVDVSQSSVVSVMYSASDPRFAAMVANAFAKAYVDTTLNLRVAPTRDAAVWFEGQLKSLRQEFEDAQGKLAAFQREKGILTTDEHADVEQARLNQLAAESLRATEATYGASTGGDATPEVVANPLVSTLKGQLLSAESKLHEMSTRLGPNHPDYIQQQAEVQALRERVNQETHRVIASVGGGYARNRARDASLKADLAAQRKKVEDMRDARNESLILQRDADTAQKAYEAALARQYVNKVESGARQTNVTILDPAAEPTFPSRPKVPLNIALGFFVGTILGLAAVFLLEILDRRVRSDPDLDAVMLGMDVPLLGTLQTWQPTRLLGGDEPRALPSPA